MLEEVKHRILTVVRACRVQVLRGKAILDAGRAEAGLVGQLLQGQILLVGPAQRPAPAVHVQIDADRRPIRLDDPHLDRTASASNLDFACLVEVDRCRKDVIALTPGSACDFDGHRVDRRPSRDERFQLCVESASFVDILLPDIDRGVGASDWHGILASFCAGIIYALRHDFAPPGGRGRSPALSAVRGGSSPHSSSISVSADTTEPLCSPSIVRMARGLAPGIVTGAPSCRTWRGPKTPSSIVGSVPTSAIIGEAIQCMVKIE